MVESLKFELKVANRRYQSISANYRKHIVRKFVDTCRVQQRSETVLNSILSVTSEAERVVNEVAPRTSIQLEQTESDALHKHSQALLKAFRSNVQIYDGNRCREVRSSDLLELALDSFDTLKTINSNLQRLLEHYASAAQNRVSSLAQQYVEPTPARRVSSPAPATLRVLTPAHAEESLFSSRSRSVSMSVVLDDDTSRSPSPSPKQSTPQRIRTRSRTASGVKSTPPPAASHTDSPGSRPSSRLGRSASQLALHSTAFTRIPLQEYPSSRFFSATEVSR